MRRKTKLIVTLTAVLLGATTLQLYPLFVALPETARPHLASAIPSQIDGWTIRDLPMAETEEGKNYLLSTLQYDDYVSRLYTHGPSVVSVYVAYWAPGKVPPRMVGVHTPDTCWVMNGWRCEERLRGATLMLGSGEQLLPGEFGIYSLKGMKQHVYFWHVVDGRAYSYMHEGAPSVHSIWAQLPDLRFGLRQKREQFFVRVSSNQPWNIIWQTPGVQVLFRALGQLAISASQSPP